SYSKERKEIVYPQTNVSTLACSPDGKTLAVGGSDGISLWDLKAPGEPRHLQKDAYSCAFSPDGKYLATWRISVTLWDVAQGKKIWEPPRKDQGAIHAVRFSPDGRLLAVADGMVIRLWDAASGTELLKMAGPDGRGGDYIWALSFAPDGRTLASGTF